MARCNCDSQTCGCKIIAGDNVTITGSGTPSDPWVIAGAAGGGGASGWASGDLKDTVAPGAPAGWLECNGQAVSRTSYPALFAAIGTTWGNGDGVNTFNVPNFNGRVRIGSGTGNPVAASGGNATTTLTIGNLPAHTHPIAHNHTMDHGHGSTGAGSANHTHTFGIQYVENTKNDGSSTRVTDINGLTGAAGTAKTATTSSSGAAHSHPIPGFTGTTGQSSAPNSGATGSGQEFSNMPPYRVVRVLIKT